MKSKYDVYLVFDLETTGLLKDNPAILELACSPFDKNLNDLKEYESGVMQVYDNRVITQGALDANGITREQITNGRDSKEVIKEFILYLKSLSKQARKIVAVGHKIDDFDLPILNDFFEVHGYDLSEYINDSFTIDTLSIAHVKWPESVNYQLGTCCQNIDIDIVNAHRAINDTRANKELAKSFIRSLRGEGTATNTNYKRPVFEW